MNNRFRIFCMCMFAILICSTGSQAPAFARRGHRRPQQGKTVATKRQVAKGKTLTMRLAGLHCEGCAMIVKDSLEKVPGVLSANVSQPKQTAILTIGKKSPSPKLLRAAVIKAGYKVVKIE